jgi:hypothetical protein
MPRELHCLHCRVTLARFSVAGGEDMVVCLECEGVGEYRHVALGARLMAEEPRTAFSPAPARRRVGKPMLRPATAPALAPDIADPRRPPLVKVA